MVYCYTFFASLAIYAFLWLPWTVCVFFTLMACMCLALDKE